jgi:2-polyprenyl-3-methyl-5-hydroxy-6-metoxy-1,4-benzoquinol methylase
MTTKSTAKELPEAAVYEKGLRYWPYRESLHKVLELVCKHAPQHGSVLDMMCGPAWLLGQIHKKRPDLSLCGMDVDMRYVRYNRATYEGHFDQGDILTWKPRSPYNRGPFNLVLCTGALHHVPYRQQNLAIKNIASMVDEKGAAIISDCYVDEYATEAERKLAAAKLGYEYLQETIQNGANDQVVAWTADILYNDVLRHEFKTSIGKRAPQFTKYFKRITTMKTWPMEQVGYGDYVHLCYR